MKRTSKVLNDSCRLQAQDGADADPESEPDMALGHDGGARVVLSDVTSHFPPEQLPEEAASKPEDAAGAFQLQRRGRQPRACRSLLSGESNAAAATNGAQTQADNSMPASSGAQGVTTLKTVLRSGPKPQPNASAASCSEASGSTTAEGQTGICTRRQARLNKQSSSQQASQNSSVQLQQSQGKALSDDDFAVLACSQRQGRTVNHPSSGQSANSQGSSRTQIVSGETQTGTGEQAFAVRRNRPRLQLNRKAKGVDGTLSGSQAAISQSAVGANATQH